MNQENPTTPKAPITPAVATDKPSMVDEAFSTDTLFCRSLVSNGYLSEQQMQQAARGYRLGPAYLI